MLRVLVGLDVPWRPGAPENTAVGAIIGARVQNARRNQDIFRSRNRVRHARSALGAEGHGKTLGARQVEAADQRFAREPLELARGKKDIRGVRGAGGFAAAAAVAIPEAR